MCFEAWEVGLMWKRTSHKKSENSAGASVPGVTLSQKCQWWPTLCSVIIRVFAHDSASR
jgi:hypothetical protein